MSDFLSKIKDMIIDQGVLLQMRSKIFFLNKNLEVHSNKIIHFFNRSTEVEIIVRDKENSLFFLCECLTALPNDMVVSYAKNLTSNKTHSASLEYCFNRQGELIKDSAKVDQELGPIFCESASFYEIKDQSGTGRKRDQFIDFKSNKVSKTIKELVNSIEFFIYTLDETSSKIIPVLLTNAPIYVSKFKKLEDTKNPKDNILVKDVPWVQVENFNSFSDNLKNKFCKQEKFDLEYVWLVNINHLDQFYSNFKQNNSFEYKKLNSKWA